MSCELERCPSSLSLSRPKTHHGDHVVAGEAWSWTRRKEEKKRMADAKRSFSWGQTTQRQKEKGTYWSGLSRKWPPFSGNESLIRKLSRNNLPVNPHFPFLFNLFLCYDGPLFFCCSSLLYGPSSKKKIEKRKAVCDYTVIAVLRETVATRQ